MADKESICPVIVQWLIELHPLTRQVWFSVSRSNLTVLPHVFCYPWCGSGLTVRVDDQLRLLWLLRNMQTALDITTCCKEIYGLSLRANVSKSFSLSQRSEFNHRELNCVLRYKLNLRCKITDYMSSELNWYERQNIIYRKIKNL